MRYIVRANTTGFGEVKVLAESPTEALQAGLRMEAPEITVTDGDGTVFSLTEFERLHRVEPGASAPELQ